MKKYSVDGAIEDNGVLLSCRYDDAMNFWDDILLVIRDGHEDEGSGPEEGSKDTLEMEQRF